MDESAPTVRETVRQLATSASAEDLFQYLAQIHPADIADAVGDLPDPVVERVFLCLGPDAAADVLAHMDHEQAADVLPDLVPADVLSDIVEEMDPDDAADFIAELDDEQAEALLGLMEDEESQEVQTLLEYPPDTAGGVMTPEVVAVRDSLTVDQAIEELRARHDVEYVGTLFVVDDRHRLIGRVRLRNLVFFPGYSRIRDVMDPEVISVPADMDQEEVARVVEHYDLLAVPVVGPDKELLGQVTVDDVIDVITEESSEDILKLAGTSLDEMSARSPWAVARYRLPWLVITMLGGLVSSVVINLGQWSIHSAEVFAVMAPFIPIMMGLAGNTGIQSSTIMTRGLATGSIQLEDLWRVIWREARVGVLMGSLFGLAVGGTAGFVEWLLGQRGYGPMLGCVVGLALSVTIPASCFLGTIVPMTLGRWGKDPAVAAGPFVTMTLDWLGLVVYFTLTLVLLGLIG